MTVIDAFVQEYVHIVIVTQLYAFMQKFI